MWSDRETENDCLGFSCYVDVLAEVCTLPDLAPLTLGIFGSWGSGKTSLMGMLRSRIEAKNNKRIKTLWFNAWRYEGRDEAQSALIHAILGKLSEDKTLWSQATDVIERIKKGASVLKLARFIGKTTISLTPDISGFIDCFSEESEKVAESMEAFDCDFKVLLEKMETDHVIVFIDDLDRCASDKVIETFETIKLFLNTPACTFVIGADSQRIEDAVGEVYGVTTPERRKDYIEKIVQVPFSIPAQDLRDITCYVGMLVIARNLVETGFSELCAARSTFLDGGNAIEKIFNWPKDNQAHLRGKPEDVRDELDGILPHVDVLARGLRGNPRQIKRFLNIVALRQRLAKANKLATRPDLLVKLAVLEYTWNDFFNAVVDTTDPTTGHSALIQEMLSIDSSEGQVRSQSGLVTESLARPGLVEFLLAEPSLDGKNDLHPYLFLAQTSLGQGTRQALVPVDEKAKSLARLIANDDPIRMKSASRQAATQDPGVVAAIIRIILTDLPSVTRTIIRTHMIHGLGEICKAHPEHFPSVMKAVSQLDPKGEEAINLAMSSFFNLAEAAGHPVNEKTKARFRSKFAEALTTPKKKTSR